MTRRSRVAAAALMALTALAVAAPGASARHLSDHVFAGSWTDPYGPTKLTSVAVDEETGYVYLVNSRAEGTPIEKYSATGTPLAFTAPEAAGSTTLLTPGSGGFGNGFNLMVDNTGNPATAGRIYAVGDESVIVYERSGKRVPYPVANCVIDGALERGTGNLWVLCGPELRQYSPDGQPTGKKIELPFYNGEKIVEDTQGDFYVVRFGVMKRVNPALEVDVEVGGVSDTAIDPTTDDAYLMSYSGVRQYGLSGSQLNEFGGPPGSPGEGLNFAAIAVNGATGDVYRTSNGVVERFVESGSKVLPDAVTGGATDFQASSAVIHGTVDPDGVPTTECYFQWGTNTKYLNKAPCDQGSVLTGSGPQQVTAELTGLTKGKTYHFRVVAVNPQGLLSGLDAHFRPSALPTFGDEHVSEVHSDGARVHALLNPEGAPTTYRFEYGLEDCEVSACSSTPLESTPTSVLPQAKSAVITGLKPETTYHYRITASNQTGESVGTDHTFTTFEITEILEDKCDNAHVRQQTGAALLLDCRAYELVSAGDAGGYNVESSLSPGQKPFESHPDATSPPRVLYGVHDGAIPGAGNPPNRGVDSYVATRGEDGWTTSYVGIPADIEGPTEPFSSTLLEADSNLDAFAYGGAEICAPCFTDGTTNIPLRLPDGRLVEGMEGSEGPVPAEPAGEIHRHFSADGSHFIFGTTAKLEPTANENGDVTVYSRNLATETTEVVSTLPGGETMTGSGIAELAVSSDGTRTIVAKKISTDPKGNEYWHPYMHVEGRQASIDLAPLASAGVLFDGMTADGRHLYFTTRDHLLPGDLDASADIYEAEVSPAGTLSLRIASDDDGGIRNDDTCTPPGDWNTPTGGPDCSALAFAGGAGMAKEANSFYFLSPETLDSSQPSNLPTAGQANLYVTRDQGAPEFVRTIDSSIGKTITTRPSHPVLDPDFVGTMQRPEALTVDQSTGDLYVISVEDGKVYRFDSSGNPVNFTTGPDAGTNTLSGFNFGGGGSEAQVGVDSSGGPLNGDIYVAEGSFSTEVRAFSATGTPIGSFGTNVAACGVTVDPVDGSVYLAEGSGAIFRFEPNAPTLPLSDEDFDRSVVLTSTMHPCVVGADGLGNVYATTRNGGTVRRYETSQFQPGLPEPPGPVGPIVDANATGLAVDPQTHDVFVDRGTKIDEFDSAGDLVSTFGGETLANSNGIAVDTGSGRVYATSGNSIVQFDSVPPPFAPIDNPAVLHAIGDSATHDYADFQTTPDGRFAAFDSVLSLTGFDNDGRYEVFRFDSEGGQLACASCNPTGARALGDSTLSSTGLGLASDGAVFFDSEDPIAPRDLDERTDAYEYENGEIQLVSTGSSAFDSKLLGISTDGTDAYFFTRDSLVPQDENGELVKIYDARSHGGFAFVPPPIPCKASDECHGAGSEAAGPPQIKTIRGTGGEEPEEKKPPTRCKRPKVLRHGRCVRKPRHHRHKHRHAKSGHGRGA